MSGSRQPESLGQALALNWCDARGRYPPNFDIVMPCLLVGHSDQVSFQRFAILVIFVQKWAEASTSLHFSNFANKRKDAHNFKLGNLVPNLGAWHQQPI